MITLVLRDVTQARGTGRRQVTVLRGASLDVRAGECVLLQGPSGSGKTTLLAVAAGLLTPSTGDVVVTGTRMGTLTPTERCRVRARQVGFVFQRANLLAGLTALDNVALAARLGGASRGEARHRAAELLDRLGVRQLATRYPRELSGGEEQRVAVARALVHGPSIVLADEPTGSLEPALAGNVMREMTSLAAATGCAIVVATHDPDLGAFATRHLYLREGTVTNG